MTRDGDTSAPLTVHYVVSGTAIAGADYQALSGAVLIAAGAATAPITVTPIDDALLESNETVVLALSAGGGYGVGSPATASIAVVSDDLPPDLVILSTAAPATGGADANIVVTDTTKNQGTGSAAASATGFYLSVNTSFEASDVFLGSRPVAQLGPSATHAASTSLRIPAATVPGSYYVIAKSDWDAQVPEGVETNNIKATASIKIGPDLVISALTTPAGAVAGGTFSVTDTTANQGGGGAGPTATRFYLSVNSSLDATDVLLGSRDVPALGPAASHAGSAVLTLPAATPGGTLLRDCQADGGKTVAETSETNNNRANSSVQGRCRPGRERARRARDRRAQQHDQRERLDQESEPRSLRARRPPDSICPPTRCWTPPTSSSARDRWIRWGPASRRPGRHRCRFRRGRRPAATTSWPRPIGPARCWRVTSPTTPVSRTSASEPTSRSAPGRRRPRPVPAAVSASPRRRRTGRRHRAGLDHEVSTCRPIRSLDASDVLLGSRPVLALIRGRGSGRFGAGDHSGADGTPLVLHPCGGGRRQHDRGGAREQQHQRALDLGDRASWTLSVDHTAPQRPSVAL